MGNWTVKGSVTDFCWSRLQTHWQICARNFASLLNL